MENTNEMTIVFDSRPVNEGMARIAASLLFCTPNPDSGGGCGSKTAVSEAVTNCIIHGYEGEIHKIRTVLKLKGREIFVDITDQGVGISDVKKAMEPLYTTKPGKRAFGNGIYIYGSFYG